jgi:CRP-like cAMP-binding protein
VALSQAKMFSTSDQSTRQEEADGVGQAGRDLLQRAGELRSMALFRHFTDELIIPLAKLVEPSSFADEQLIFSEGDAGRDLKIIREGVVRVTRTTPVGTQVLTNLERGALFGEISYLDDLGRSASAHGVGTGSIYTIPSEALDAAVEADRELAVSLLWGFWQTLATKVRAANTQMSELFGAPSAPLTQGRSNEDVGQRVQLSEEDKLDILREQGLSAQELRLLAKYSREMSYGINELIFAEGDPGDCLYIVVEGSVRISRMVPGMGEECLSILSRGEVFGELALIDEQPRSADARSHSATCTVFSISRSLLEEVLSMDPDAAVQFLNLLCRLLCRRLRAMNERLVAWRIMASHE